MPNFIVVRPFIYVFGTIIDQNQNNPNENTIYGGHNGAMNQSTGHTHSGTIGDGPKVAAANVTIVDVGGFYVSTDVEGALQEIGSGSAFGFSPPVGTIIAFYDYGPGQLTFNPINWAYCVGQVLNVPTIGGPPRTLPDLSGRYLVGFGTDGGANNGTAPFLTPTVGNAGNQVNIQHNHAVGPFTMTIAGHTHTVNPHAHTVAAHTHVLPAFTGAILQTGNANFSINVGGVETLLLTNGPAEVQGNHSHILGGSTAAASPATDAVGLTTNATALTTNANTVTSANSLSTTQSIQPISIRVRFLMRIQ